MPRQPRGEIPAGSYHVTTRTAGPIPMFRDDTDRTWFCNRLGRIVREHEWTCHAFCLMPTHYHLVVEVQLNSLQPGMKRLNGPYAQWFNWRYGRSGHLCGARYYAGSVTAEGHELHLLRYLARNPVEAGICSKPSNWAWGSYRGCAGIDPGFAFVDSSRLRAYFGRDEREACRLLRDFVGDS